MDDILVYELTISSRVVYSDMSESESDLAAGVVNQTGDVVDQAGNTVGRITEGKPADLVGAVVTTAGDIVAKTGEVVGKAVPLRESSGNAPKGTKKETQGGWGVMGTVKSVNNLVRTVDNTVQTATKLTPATMDLAKGLGLGIGQQKGENEEPVKGTTVVQDQILQDPKAADKAEDGISAQSIPDVPEALGKQPRDLSETQSNAAPITLEEKDQQINDSKFPEESCTDKNTKIKIDQESQTAKEPRSGSTKQGKLEEKSNPGDLVLPNNSAIDNGLVQDETAPVSEIKSQDESTLEKRLPVKTCDIQPELAEKQDDLAEPLVLPLDNLNDATISEDGKLFLGDKSIGNIVEGGIKDLKDKKTDPKGNVIDEAGEIVGKVELEDEVNEELEKEAAATTDFAILKEAKVNKAGNLVNDKGEVVGRVTEGILKNLIGKRGDENGQFWNDSGKMVGKAQPIPDTERENYKEPAPFEDFPEATVQSDGKIMSNGEVIGMITDGEPKKLKGKKVDEDGDILDKNGNVIGKAEPWEEPEAPPQPKKDFSILAGKRVNKAGNVVDLNGQIFGRIVHGDVKRMVGRMCDKYGNILSESGGITGKAEVVSEGEREGFKDGPFAELPGCTVAREGKVVTLGGDVVGRLLSGDPKVLIGRSVDEDGDILDRNGNSIGKAERWEEPIVEKKKDPLAGRRVNREGNVVNEDGNLIGRLISGEITICSGKEIDDDGDVVDSKGNTIGHASLLADIPPEPVATESPEDKGKRDQLEQDKKLAKQMAACVGQCLDKIRPICKMITQKIDKAESTPRDELDEEELVKQVKPLIEEGSRILNEANGIIRGLDPDGHIQANAKHKTAIQEASPEEFHLADVLKELTGTVTECIDNAKRKIGDMPHAKKELNPLWGLLTEPLFQILAAVGLLLNGVLGLVGRLVR
jgi:hypothetical protein